VTTCTSVAALVDTNVLVYRFDPRFPDKQRVATEVLRDGIRSGELRLAHQTVVLSWFDAHMWAHAEAHGLEELLSENLQHDRTYGSVRVVNPFAES
jgi:predicted nucleic acid-binding protein